MDSLVAVPLEGGGVVLFEAGPEADGPVKAGRAGDVVRELPRTLQECLEPVTRTARAVLDAVRQAGPDEVEVGFGVNLSAQAGAVVVRGESGVHLTVRVLWHDDSSADNSR
ncbi:CU044_2847 family protein [Streptomyces sp. NPDC060205]|uniref:CU044_2847 family protein n=1 Tax=Streptomyces sp. NPDC060205 TaxID=3347072 RepID=UPI0036653B7A